MGNVHTKVAVVLRFIDAVTEQWVKSAGGRPDITVKVRQQNKVLWKAADCAVILAQPGVRSVDIAVSGGGYLENSLCICLPEDDEPQIRYLWMQPAADYPFTADMTVIRGRCVQGRVTGGLYAVWITENVKYKLMGTTVPGEDSILLWGMDKIVEERGVLLCENGESEYVTLCGQNDGATYSYRVRGGISKVFHKGSAKVYMASKLSPDSSGRFLAAYLHWEKRCKTIQFWQDNRCEAEVEIGDDKEYCVWIGGQGK